MLLGGSKGRAEAAVVLPERPQLHVAIRLVLPLSLVAAFAYLLMPVSTSPRVVVAAAPLVLGALCLLAAGNLPKKI